MKKLILFLLAALLLCTACFGESFTGRDGWLVRFTPGNKLIANLDEGAIHDSADALQPGDDITFSIQILNSNRETTEWYLRNDVLHSLEDRSSVAAGGAYGYRLSYVAANGAETVLFDSDTVGGETVSPAGEGLHAATEALRDYFYLTRLESGQGGTVVLRIALEGESQGNDYQDTLADLKLGFAVALDDGTITVVTTGDETNLLPLYIVMGVSGVALLGIGVFTLVRRRRKGGADA